MRKNVEVLRHTLENTWGQGTTLELIAPELTHVPRAREFIGRYERMCVSPRAGCAHLRWLLDIDVRPVARTLQVATLVVHRAGDRLIPVPAGRALAREISMARYVELSGDAHPPWIGDTAALVDEIQQFLTGSRAAVDVERVLATVLFTGIVGSTERAVALGDRAWRDLRASRGARPERVAARRRHQVRRHATLVASGDALEDTERLGDAAEAVAMDGRVAETPAEPDADGAFLGWHAPWITRRPNCSTAASVVVPAPHIGPVRFRQRTGTA